MYKLDIDSAKKLVEINNMLNQIEVKGFQNLNYLGGAIISLQQIIQKLEEQNVKEEPPISVSNKEK